LEKVTFDLQPLTQDQEMALHDHAQEHAVGQGAAG
jgi:hypothetical protein